MGLNKKCGAQWLDQMTAWSAGIGSVSINGTWLALFNCDVTYLDANWSSMGALESKELQCTNNALSTYAPGYSRVCIGQVGGLHAMNQCYQSSIYNMTTTNKNVIYFEENYDYTSGATQIAWPQISAFGIFDHPTYRNSASILYPATLIAWGTVNNGATPPSPVTVSASHVALFRRDKLTIAFNDANT